MYVVVTGHGAVIDLTVTKQKEAAAHAGQATWMLWRGNDCGARTSGLLVTLRLPALVALQIQLQTCYAM